MSSNTLSFKYSLQLITIQELFPFSLHFVYICRILLSIPNMQNYKPPNKIQSFQKTQRQNFHSNQFLIFFFLSFFEKGKDFLFLCICMVFYTRSIIPNNTSSNINNTNTCRTQVWRNLFPNLISYHVISPSSSYRCVGVLMVNVRFRNDNTHKKNICANTVNLVINIH